MQVSSCFSQLLNLHNLSEEISSAQLERAVRIGEVGLSMMCIFLHVHISMWSVGSDNITPCFCAG